MCATSTKFYRCRTSAPQGEGTCGGHCSPAALGFLALEPHDPELHLMHRCFDNWRGVGDIVTGMARQGYQVSLDDHGSGQ